MYLMSLKVIAHSSHFRMVALQDLALFQKVLQAVTIHLARFSKIFTQFTYMEIILAWSNIIGI